MVRASHWLLSIMCRVGIKVLVLAFCLKPMETILSLAPHSCSFAFLPFNFLVVLNIIRNLSRHAMAQYKAEGKGQCTVLLSYEKDLAKHFMAHFPLGESRASDAGLAASLHGMHKGDHVTVARVLLRFVSHSIIVSIYIYIWLTDVGPGKQGSQGPRCQGPMSR